MNGATGFYPAPVLVPLLQRRAMESFDDYDYGDVLRGLRALGVRYVIVQTDPNHRVNAAEGPRHLAAPSTASRIRL